MMFSDKEKEKIIKFRDEHNFGIDLEIILTGTEKDELFKTFSQSFSSLSAEVSCVNKKVDDGIPGIRLRDNVIFNLIPTGKFLDIFLDSLVFLSRNPSGITRKLSAIKIYQKLKIYIAEQCPFCPSAVKKLLELAFSKNIRLEIIDGVRFSEHADKDNVKSTPLAVLDQTYKWTGVPDMKEIIDILSNRDPSKLSADSLMEMIGEGRASHITSIMCDRNIIFPAFLKLLAHSKWSYRLGAMVAMEELIERNRELAESAVPGLWDLYKDVDDSVRGDIVYIIGETGHSGSLGRLTEVSTGKGPDDLIEAALDAMVRIDEIHH